MASGCGSSAPPLERRSSSEARAAEAALAGEDDSDTIETTIWMCREAYVYQIPPLRSADLGHRANDWDINKWLWQGALKVNALRDELFVVLHDPTSGELFARTPPITGASSNVIDAVTDSSRYFALRIADAKDPKKHAVVGLGFRDRSYAYDFNATLQDHWKRVLRQKEADDIRKEALARAASEPMRDLSLKEGEKLSIKVNLPGGGEGKPRRARAEGSGAPSMAANGLLAPPPKAGMLAPPPKAGAPAPAPAPAPDDNDGFGDFGNFEAAADGADDDFGDFKS